MSLESLKSRMVSGSFWAILGEILVGGARALSYVVYAKFLSPTDFGLIGFSLLIINLFPLVIDNSLGLTLMRQPENDQRVYSTIFCINVGLAILAIAALWLVSPWAAEFLHDRRVDWILPILGFQVIFNSLCSVHIAIARRRFQYRRLVPVRLISTVCSLSLGLPLAIRGYAYWALVGASLAGALSQMIAAQFLLGWRPTLQFDRSIARSISSFTAWVAVDMGVTWMVMSGGGFFLAFYLGAHELGFFQLSDRIDTYFLGTIMSPLIPVLYAGFCEVSTETAACWRLFERSIKALTPLSLIAMGIVIIAAHPLQGIIGAKWRGVAGVITLNVIADAVSYTILPVPSLLRARGLAKLVAGVRIVTVAVQIAVYMSVAKLGLIAFLLGKLGIEIAIYAASFAVLRVTFAQPVLRLIGWQIGQAALISICAIVGVMAADVAIGLGDVLSLFIGIAVFCVPTGLLIFLTQRHALIAVLEHRITAR